MSQQNNQQSNGKGTTGGSSKIHPVNEPKQLRNTPPDRRNFTSESDRGEEITDGSGINSNRKLLGENYVVSNQQISSIQPSSLVKSRVDGMKNNNFQGSNTQKDQTSNNVVPQEQIAERGNSRQEMISIKDHLETETEKHLLATDAGDRIVTASYDFTSSVNEPATGKKLYRVEFDLNGSLENKELTTALKKSRTKSQFEQMYSSADDGNHQSKNKNKSLKKKGNGKKMKQNNTLLTQNDDLKVIKSYISIADNTQLKSALTAVGKQNTLTHSIKLPDGVLMDESSDSEFTDQPWWIKIWQIFIKGISLANVIPFNSPFRIGWDFLIISLALWVCFTTPLDIAFQPLTFKLRGIRAFHQFIDIIFIVDILINFRTSIADFITGDEIFDSKIIANRYLKGQFFIDLIGAIPMDLILDFSSNAGATSELSLQDAGHHRILGGSAAAASSNLPYNATSSIGGGGSHGSSDPSFLTTEILNIISILKIVRILRFTKIITFLNTSEHVKLSLRLFKLIFYLMIYIHWQACAWFYYTKWDRMWFPLPDIIKQDVHFYDHGVVFTYCFSIWHSVSILDGDDMVPANSHQAIVVSVLVIVSEFIHAHIIGTMDVVLHSLSSKSEHFQEKIEFVTSTMKSVRINNEVQQKVLKYVSMVHSQLDQRKQLNKLMDTLSPSLQQLITRHMFMELVHHHPVFKGLPDLFEFIAESIEAVQYMPEQYIIKEGSKATHLYILEEGSCEVLVKGSVLRKEIFVQVIESGNIFGEVALITGLRRTASVRSRVHCTVGQISEENFNELIRHFPEVKNRMKEQCRKYSDHWKDYQINVLANIHYLRNVPYNVREDLHYKLKIEHFESGARLFNRGQECECIMIIVSGQVELFVEQREQEYILDTLGIGSTIGAYSVLNNNHYEYTGRAKNKVSCLLIKRQDLLDAAEKDHIMTEALDGATQYIVHNEIPLCDYSTLNNKDPIDTKSYQDQFDYAVLPIERFKRAIEKVMVLNRRNEPKLSKLFATIRRLKEDRDLKANILGQVSSGIVNPENENLGQKLRRGIQNALSNLQKAETKAQSDNLMTSLKAQFQEKEQPIGVAYGGVGVPMKEFYRMMQMIERLQVDMNKVKGALKIESSASRRNSNARYDNGQGLYHQNSNRRETFASQLSPYQSRHQRQSHQSPVHQQEPTLQEKMENLNKEQAALPVKKNIIALLINAKIELQKEALLKEQKEKEAAAAALAQEEAMKLKQKGETNEQIIKENTDEILSKRSFKNSNSGKKNSFHKTEFKEENPYQSPRSLNVRKQITSESHKIQQYSVNSKNNSGSSFQGKHSDKGLHYIEDQLSAHNYRISPQHHENSPNTRASSVLRRRDPFHYQNPNQIGNNNQQEQDDQKIHAPNFMASEAYSNTFDVPQIAKDSSPQIIRHHYTMADENFQEILSVHVPLLGVNRTEQEQKDDVKKQLDQESKEVENNIDNKVKSMEVSQSQQTFTKQDLQQNEPIQDAIPNDTKINDRLSLDQTESANDDDQEEQDDKFDDQQAIVINSPFKTGQGPSRNTSIGNQMMTDPLQQQKNLSLSSIELKNNSNIMRSNDQSKIMIGESAKLYQQSLHKQRSNFPTEGLPVTPPNNTSSNNMINQESSNYNMELGQNRNVGKSKERKVGPLGLKPRTKKSSDYIHLQSNILTGLAGGGGTVKQNKNNAIMKKEGKLNSNLQLIIQSELSSDATPINQYGGIEPNSQQINFGLYQKAYQANKKTPEININTAEGSLQYIEKYIKSPQPQTIPQIIENKTPLDSNQLLHPKSRAEAGRENPYLGSLPVPKLYKGSISPNEKSNRSQVSSANKQKSNQRRRDQLSPTKDQEMMGYQPSKEQQQEPDAGIEDMIEQEIARIHEQNTAKIQRNRNANANREQLINFTDEEEETEMKTSNTNQNKNKKKITGNSGTNNNNMHNKQNNR